MDKYSNPDSYVMCELKKAHEHIKQLENNLDEAVAKLREVETKLINQNAYIIKLEEDLGLVGDV